MTEILILKRTFYYRPGGGTEDVFGANAWRWRCIRDLFTDAISDTYFL